jgi:hypothetical protein
MNDEALGSLSDGPRDDRLQAQPDRLKRPRGALIAFRQSGGFRFSTHEAIVYNDGRVIIRHQGKLDSREGSRRIMPDEVADLKETIEQSGLFKLPQSIGRQNPDGYAYELIARVGRKSTAIEFFDGSIPPEVQPLLAQLKTLLNADDAQENNVGSG